MFHIFISSLDILVLSKLVAAPQKKRTYSRYMSLYELKFTQWREKLLFQTHLQRNYIIIYIIEHAGFI